MQLAHQFQGQTVKGQGYRWAGAYCVGRTWRPRCLLNSISDSLPCLPRQQWSPLNCFRTEQGHCGACKKKWQLTDTDLCLCGETQTMSHIVESCPPDKTEWQLISATLCGWGRCFMADQLWLMKCIREEDFLVNRLETAVFNRLLVVCI